MITSGYHVDICGISTPSQGDSGICFNLSGVPNGSFILCRELDFGCSGATGFRAEAKISGSAGWIEIRLDGPEGARIGICQTAGRDLGVNRWGVVRTGVYAPSGIHDVCLRFSGFEDVEAEIRDIRFTSDPVADIRFNGVALPPGVPYLGPLEDYFIGSGIAGAGGNAAGVWDYLIGPGYTFHGYVKSCESFIRREELMLEIDGQVASLDFEMRRVQGTGMFAGTAIAGAITGTGTTAGDEAGAMRVHVAEFANRGENWVCRFIRVENLSGEASCEVDVHAVIVPDGFSHSFSKGRALALAHGCDGKSSGKHAAIGFTGSAASAGPHGEACLLRSGPRTLTAKGTPGDAFEVALLHRTFSEAQTESQCAASIADMDEIGLAKEAGHCIMEWTAWLATSGQLAGQPRGRVRDALEGALVIIRMLQGVDGGIMATARSYMDSYVRDSAGAARGLTAFGFHREAEDFLQWVHRKFELYHDIVCNANIGDDAGWFPGYGGEDNRAAESPALYLLAARDYDRCMRAKDRKEEGLGFLRKVGESLRFAVRTQLESLLRNDWKLRFNGDETESGGSGIPLADPPDLARYWSMPSLALCAASLEFYIEFLTSMGEDASNCAMGAGDARTDLRTALSQIKDSIDLNFWRTDLPEYPEGFYDWYRTETGGWPRCRITNFSLFPACHDAPLNHPERAELSVRAMKRHYSPGGYLPIQPGGLNEGFCGHDLGYLLHSLWRCGDPLAESVFESLTCGGTMGCWGTWSEAYSGDGMTHALPREPSGYLVANMRPFETGVNIAAIAKYTGTRKRCNERL